MDDPRAVLGLLAEPDRLRVVAALVLRGPCAAEDVARHAGLGVVATRRVLARLQAGGLAAEDAAGWSWRSDALREVMRGSAPDPGADPGAGADAARAPVLRAFLRDGRLSSIPAQRGKRLVVLEHVVQAFEIGIRYPEREVDATLRAFHPDHAALRRYLVDEGLLSREAGEYWRSGGPVEV